MDPKVLVEAIEGAGFAAKSYSGRSMYGRTCVGFETDECLFQAAVKIAAHQGVREDLLPELSELDVREDAMGRNTIVYFPEVPWPGGRQDEEDED